MSEEGSTPDSTAEAVSNVASSMLKQPNGTPATSEQMAEMISLLKTISDNNAKNKKNDDTSTTTHVFEARNTTKSSNASAVVRNGIHKIQSWIPRRLPPVLPHHCHPIRKWTSNNKLLASLVLAMIILVSLSASNHFNDMEGFESASSSSSTSSEASSSASSSLSAYKYSMSLPSKLFGKTDTTVYYHITDDDKAVSLPKNDYPYGTGSAICILVSSRQQDVEDVQVALRSLVFLKGEGRDNEQQPIPLAPVLIFHEGDLSPEQIKVIRDATNRPIAFPVIDLSVFPSGFDPEGPLENAPPGFEVANRRPWGYYQMIRFWITRIWEHDAIQRFDVIMRMDSDSCFTEPNKYLPQMLHNHLVYQSQYVGTEPPPGRPYIEGLYDFATNYLAKNNKLPGNSLLWQFIQTTWNSQNTLPLFRTNFEIVKRNFMQRPDVKQWHMALTEGEPYGVLRYRWGDAVIRFFDAAIFASDETTLTIKPDGYNHKQHCTWPEVQQALKAHNLF